MQVFNPKSISFSKKAINHFRNSLQQRGGGEGIKIGVKEAGCSGYEYVFDFIDNIDINDYVFEEKGCNIYIDNHSLKFLSGSLVDYSEDGLNKGIKFINPNAKAVCGCGESFTI